MPNFLAMVITKAGEWAIDGLVSAVNSTIRIHSFIPVFFYL